MRLDSNNQVAERKVSGMQLLGAAYTLALKKGTVRKVTRATKKK